MRTENKALEQIKASWFLDVFSIVLVQVSLFFRLSETNAFL